MGKASDPISLDKFDNGKLKRRFEEQLSEVEKAILESAEDGRSVKASVTLTINVKTKVRDDQVDVEVEGDVRAKLPGPPKSYPTAAIDEEQDGKPRLFLLRSTEQLPFPEAPRRAAAQKGGDA